MSITLLKVKAPSASNSSFGLIVAVTSLSFVVVSLDVSIVNVALIPISRTYKASVSTLQWVVDAYTLAFSVLLLSAGNLSDQFGATRIFRLGILVFGLASVGCGLADSAAVLIVFRTLQGIGAATMIPSSLAILNQSFSHNPANRARAVGLWTAAGSSAIAAGPIVGGFLMQVTDWPIIFFVNAPLCLTGILLSYRLPQSCPAIAREKFDIPGQIAWMLCIIPLIVAIIEWPRLGISNTLIYGGLLVSILMFFSFLTIEKKVNSPLLPLNIFNCAPFNALLFLGAILNGAYYGTIFVLSLYLQSVLHYSTLAAGLAFLPLTAGFVISNLLSAKIINGYGIRVPILIGLLLFSAGFSGLFIARADTSYEQLFFPFLIIPIGMGLAVPAMTTGILSSVENVLSGTASAVLNTVRQAGGAIGVALIGSIAEGGTEAIVHAIRASSIITVACTIVAFSLCNKYLKIKKNS